MRDVRSHVVQYVALAAAAGLLAASASLRAPLDQMSRDYGLVKQGVLTEQHSPLSVVLTVLPGGLRSPIIAYLWMQADDLKSKGRYYDAQQKADLICTLQPQFAGVWVFQAWNMAYNISASAQTPDHRWLWVNNGIELLRDRGIAINPQSLILYKELAWIFHHKLGGNTDEMHMTYKARWASIMQHLLAPQPYGETQEAINAFRPIAEAPLDKDPAMQARYAVQPAQLALLLQDPAVAEYARLLGEYGLRIEPSLLDAYNRYSNDECLKAVRPPNRTQAGADDFQRENDPIYAKAVAGLINSPPHAAARGKILAFLRAQVLWNKYRMDPQWMLSLMEKYGPLDWRLVWPHAMYWATYGFHKVQGTPLESLGHIDALNSSRIILNSLKDLTWGGRLTYVENPANPNAPGIDFFFDPRFVAPAEAEFESALQRSYEERQEVEQDNVYRASHINYLVNVIEMLYPMGRHEQAGQILDYIKTHYKMTGNEWDKDLEDFVVYKLNVDGRPVPARAAAQIVPAIQTAYLQQLRGNENDYGRYIRYAHRIYANYQDAAPASQKLKPFEEFHRDVLAFLLARPRAAGYYLDLPSRIAMFRMIDVSLQRAMYDGIAPELRMQCAAERIDFDKAFPEPPGMTEFRKERAGLLQ